MSAPKKLDINRISFLSEPPHLTKLNKKNKYYKFEYNNSFSISTNISNYFNMILPSKNLEKSKGRLLRESVINYLLSKCNNNINIKNFLLITEQILFNNFFFSNFSKYLSSIKILSNYFFLCSSFILKNNLSPDYVSTMSISEYSRIIFTDNDNSSIKKFTPSIDIFKNTDSEIMFTFLTFEFWHLLFPF